MLRRYNFLLPLGFAVALFFGFRIGLLVAPNGDKPSLFGKNQLSRMDEVLQYVRDNYVDTVNTDNMQNKGIIEMLSTLDPHSSFIPVSRTAAADDELNGNFQGIGLQFLIVEDTVFVVEVIKGGPSEKSGIVAGDRIISANDETIAGKKMKSADIQKKLKGVGGSKVKLGILHSGNHEVKFVTITRGVVPVNSVDAHYMIDKEIGYIKFARFSGSSYEEFKSALDGLMKQGMKKLILDLRGNGGGLLDQATDIIDEMLEQSKLMVYTEGRTSTRQDYKTRFEGSFEMQPLAVLIDEGSASASEIVAGALQDWDRAEIIGRRSFGKGLVQQPFNLSDGSELRLTIAKYYTPSGRCIQKPYEKSLFDYYDEVYMRGNSGELYSADSIHINDTTRYFTAGNRVVYGGGGIIPDVFVPKDSVKMNAFIKEVLDKNLAEQFVYLQFGRMIPVKKYASLNELLADNLINDEVYKAFIIYCKSKGLEATQYNVTSAARNYLVAQMNLFLAQIELGSNSFYELQNRIDKTMLKAVDEMKKKK